MLVNLVTIVKIWWTSLNGSLIIYVKCYITIIQRQIMIKKIYKEWLDDKFDFFKEV